MSVYQSPGVYRRDVYPEPSAEMRTGVPVLLGYAETSQVNSIQTLTLWPQFIESLGQPLPGGYLAFAVHGFFANGGQLCHVVRLNEQVNVEIALSQGLDAVTSIDTVDLVCAPDVMRQAEMSSTTTDPIWAAYHARMPYGPDPEGAVNMQGQILERCERLGDRFAILDSLPGASVEEVLAQREHLRVLAQREHLSGANGGLYYPWVRIMDSPVLSEGFVPPCGHVAGVYARSDLRVGVHKAPANDILESVLDLEISLSNAQQDLLNPKGVNCLRAFPGRGIRVWGARTLSPASAWTYVNVRRLFLTAARWIERNTLDLAFEPSDARLWTRIGRELTGYFTDLFQRGALKGRTPEEAFFVKCDAETNPREVRELGHVVTEIGLAPTVPNEFVVVRIIHGASGIVISGPTRPVSP